MAVCWWLPVPISALICLRVCWGTMASWTCCAFTSLPFVRNKPCVVKHVFHTTTLPGHPWITDYIYGDPDKEEHFQALLSYLPLHNVAPVPNGQYPAMMLTTGHLVVPLHSHKLIAELQHKLGVEGSTQRNPTLERVAVRAGHRLANVIEEEADCYAFAAAVICAPWKGPTTRSSSS